MVMKPPSSPACGLAALVDCTSLVSTDTHQAPTNCLVLPMSRAGVGDRELCRKSTRELPVPWGVEEGERKGRKVGTGAYKKAGGDLTSGVNYTLGLWSLETWERSDQGS